jgi:hypothetical protein
VPDGTGKYDVMVSEMLAGQRYESVFMMHGGDDNGKAHDNGSDDEDQVAGAPRSRTERDAMATSESPGFTMGWHSVRGCTGNEWTRMPQALHKFALGKTGA